ncbi:Uncharacterised protein [Klebsiella pneumoniae]|nr:Uncharacterised protein [Klebsiella pneumoniae]
MAIGGRLLHASPFRLVGAGEDRRRIGEGTGGQRQWLAHHGLQHALGGSVAEAALAPCHVGDAAELAVVQADMEIQAQRCRGARHDGLARLAAVDPADHLAEQPAIGNRCIAVRFTRRPPGLLGGQCRGHRLPVVECLGRHLLAQRRQAGAMAEQLAHADRCLAGRGELGPVACHRRVQFELALGHQLQHGNGGEGLGAGEQIEDGVALPGLLAVLVRDAAPEVDHRLATDLQAQRRAALLRIVEKPGEGLGKRGETAVTVALRRHGQVPVGKWSGHSSSPRRPCEP